MASIPQNLVTQLDSTRPIKGQAFAVAELTVLNQALKSKPGSLEVFLPNADLREMGIFFLGKGLRISTSAPTSP